MEEYLPNTSDVLASVLFLRQDLNIFIYIKTLAGLDGTPYLSASASQVIRYSLLASTGTRHTSDAYTHMQTKTLSPQTTNFKK